MESLDTYIEKSKKLTDTIKAADKAKALSMEHNSLVEQLKSKTPRHTDTTDSKLIPTVTCTAKMNAKFGSRPSDQQHNVANAAVTDAEAVAAADCPTSTVMASPT